MSVSPPLTERVLRRLGRPRWLWVALWSLSSFLIYELTRRFATLPTYPGIVYSAMSAYANFIGLTGWLPGNTGLWVYTVIASDLYQLGRRPLHLRPFEEDRSLGLRPVGTVASRGILMLSVGAIPLAAAGVRDPRSFVALLTVFAAGIVLMMAALWPIHAQMVALKTQTLRRIRRLVAETLRPVTANWSADALQHQAQALQAAGQVERRAAAIQEWPFDETILARIAAILTAVTATIIARLVLSSFGL